MSLWRKVRVDDIVNPYKNIGNSEPYHGAFEEWVKSDSLNLRPEP